MGTGRAPDFWPGAVWTFVKPFPAVHSDCQKKQPAMDVLSVWPLVVFTGPAISLPALDSQGSALWGSR